MSLTPSQRRDISDLASRATDGALDAASQMKLESLLRESPEARAYYVRFMAISAGLAWAARNETYAASRAKTPVSAPGKPSFASSWRYTWGQVGAAAAVLILALFGSWLMVSQKPVTPPVTVRPDPGIATMTNAVNIEWNQDVEPPHIRNVLKPGWLRMNSGLAEVEFIGGTDVWVVGPSAFRLDSAKQGYLVAGKLVAQVPHGSDGFEVDVPYGKVVDHGTAFGIELRPGSATVHVLEGSVVVTPTHGLAKTYVAGQAVTLSDSAVTVGNADARVFEAFGYAWNGMSFEQTNTGVGTGHGGHHSLGPQPWKGYDALEGMRQQLGIPVERWEKIKAPLSSYLELQWEVRCLGRVGELNDFSRAAWDLYFGTQNSYLTEDDLQKRLDAYREAREAVLISRDKLEAEIVYNLTASEEAQLVDMGVLLR